jgi:hypothetical protein
MELLDKTIWNPRPVIDLRNRFGIETVINLYRNGYIGHVTTIPQRTQVSVRV